MSIIEKIILYQIKKGDEHAFTLFYDNHKDEIYRFIYFKVSDEEKANDLASESFIKIYKYIKDGEEIENFRAFLFKIARNLVIDFYRTRKWDLPIDGFVENTIPTEQNIENDIDKKLELEKLAYAVKKLPEPYREVITLRYISDVGFKEISRLIGKSKGNCQIIAHRGVKKIKQILESM